jgi:hypothetical protein
VPHGGAPGSHLGAGDHLEDPVVLVDQVDELVDAPEGGASTSAATRKPRLPVELSGPLALRAATR